MNNIIEEFKNIFKYETIIKIDDMKYLNDEYVEHVKQHTDILFIINVEYDAPSDECCLNYYNCFWGSKQFNNLLEKHKLRYEYYDQCIAFIYKDYDYDLLV
jgi:hypothetical protein